MKTFADDIAVLSTHAGGKFTKPSKCYEGMNQKNMAYINHWELDNQF